MMLPSLAYYANGKGRAQGSIAVCAIQRFCLFLADEAQPHVALDFLAVTILRVAESATTWHLDHQAIAGGNGLEALGLELGARGQRQPAVAAGLAAVAAACRMLY